MNDLKETLKSGQHVEFKVRPVTRYIVTRYSQNLDNAFTLGSSENCAELSNVRQANMIAHALAVSEAKDNQGGEVYYKLYSHDYDESEFPNNGMIRV